MIARLFRFVARLLGVVVVLGGAGVLLAASISPTARVAADSISFVEREVFDFPPLPPSFDEANERSVILARDGTRLAVLRDENRDVVPLERVPQHVQDAVVATEDHEFREHRGVNWKAIARAALDNARAGTVTSGASTISQQLVKTLTSDSERTLQRKVREASYALELERRWPKERILEEYLNRAYFANQVYGVATAAEYYWGKDVTELSVDEGALLAGLIRAPAVNDPIEHPEAARARRNIVLGQMATHGFLDADQARALQARPLRLDVRESAANARSFFATYIKTLLAAEPALGPDPSRRLHTADTGGLVIRTTLDPRLQALAESAIREVLPDPGGPQAALVAVDPRSGEILAVAVGPQTFGDGPGQTQVSPAVPGLGSPFGRQPGSAFKAFAVVAALEAGVSPRYTIDTPSPYIPSGQCADVPGQKEPWTPGNYSDGGGGVLDMAQATAKSSNVYFAHLVDRFLGAQRLVETAQRMGVRGPLGAHCAAVLGANEVYALDLAAGLAPLANSGIACPPHAITEILDRDGNALVQGAQPCRQAVDRAVAARATALLRGPIEGGTASRNGRIDRPAAGKTGTTSDYRDAWFAGFIPQLAAAVWVGYEQPAPLYDGRCPGGRVTGGCLPTMIWQRFLQRAAEGLPVVDFEQPPAPTVPVPDVVGRRYAEAVEALHAAGLRADVEPLPAPDPQATASPAPSQSVEQDEQDYVVAQNPAAGTLVDARTLVSLRLGGRDEVPRVRGDEVRSDGPDRPRGERAEDESPDRPRGDSADDESPDRPRGERAGGRRRGQDR